MQGWIKLHRKILQSPIWQDPYYLKLWMYCLLKASHKEHEQLVGNQLIKLQAGQFVTGRFSLTEDLNQGMKPKQQLSSSSWWRYLKNLEEWGMLNIKTNNKFSVVTIVKYGIYQDQINENEQQMNSSWTADEQQMNTNKNGKNGKNISSGGDIGDQVGKTFQMFHQHFITNQFMDDKLSSYLDDGMDPEIIQKAIEITKENNRDVSYLWGVLNRNLERGIKTIEQYEQYEQEWRERKRREKDAQGWKHGGGDTGTDPTDQNEGYYSQLGIGRRI